MIRTLMKNWWLLALCGILDGIISVIYFAHDTGFQGWSTIAWMGELALAAGACAIAAGAWRPANGTCWLLALNGVASGALGLILTGISGHRIGLQLITVLFVVMAVSGGILQWTLARTLPRQGYGIDARVLGPATAVSVGFAMAFLALGFGWIKLEPGSNLDLLWMGSYFGHTAICMLGLALRLRGLRTGSTTAWSLGVVY
jgi:hypothetical protein